MTRNANGEWGDTAIFERNQFVSATNSAATRLAEAGNGRRGLCVLVVGLVATLGETGQEVVVRRVESGGIVVRGRSPSQYVKNAALTIVLQK